MNTRIREISKTFVRQQDQSDCGVACLRSVVRFYGGDCSLEQLRQWSGTSRSGTTLLGLVQAARKLGLVAEGMEAEQVENLNELKSPAILHVVIENRQHYLVYYPSAKENNHYLLGDPASGLSFMSGAALEKIWQTKALLQLDASPQLIQEKSTNKWPWIMALLKVDLHILLTALLIGIILSVLGLSTAIFSQRLIDIILPKGNTGSLVSGLLIVTFLLLIKSGLGYLRGLFILKQGQDFNNRIIRLFYNHLLNLPKSFFDTRKVGELIARMNDTRRIQATLNTIFGSLVIDFLIVAASTIFVFTYSTWAGGIILVSLPVFALLLRMFSKSITLAQREVMTGYALMESNFVDTISGVTDIKVMNGQPFFEKANAQVCDGFQQKITSLGRLNLQFTLSAEVMGTIFLTGVLGVASWHVLYHEMKIGEMVALLGITSSLIPALNRMVLANIQIQEASVVFDRMYEFTSMTKEAIHEGKAMDQSNHLHLQLNDVSFRFPGRKQILSNLSLQLQTGEMIGLVGESGGGKSTLLQLIQKFYLPESGALLVNGIDLKEYATEQWRSILGCVSQEVKIFNNSLLFNITLSDEVAVNDRAFSFCKQAGFDAYFQQLPQSYLTWVGEEGVNLSGGQKQLVAFARALFRNPKLLILDEATSAMDRNMEDFVLGILKKNKQHMAVLLVTHRMRTVQQCDHVFILEKGTITSLEAPADLKP